MEASDLNQCFLLGLARIPLSVIILIKSFMAALTHLFKMKNFFLEFLKAAWDHQSPMCHLWQMNHPKGSRLRSTNALALLAFTIHQIPLFVFHLERMVRIWVGPEYCPSRKSTNSSSCWLCDHGGWNRLTLVRLGYRPLFGLQLLLLSFQVLLLS